MLKTGLVKLFPPAVRPEMVQPRSIAAADRKYTRRFREDGRVWMLWMIPEGARPGALSEDGMLGVACRHEVGEEVEELLVVHRVDEPRRHHGDGRGLDLLDVAGSEPTLLVGRHVGIEDEALEPEAQQIAQLR